VQVAPQPGGTTPPTISFPTAGIASDPRATAAATDSATARTPVRSSSASSSIKHFVVGNGFLTKALDERFSSRRDAAASSLGNARAQGFCGQSATTVYGRDAASAAPSKYPLRRIPAAGALVLRPDLREGTEKSQSNLVHRAFEASPYRVGAVASSSSFKQTSRATWRDRNSKHVDACIRVDELRGKLALMALRLVARLSDRQVPGKGPLQGWAKRQHGIERPCARGNHPAGITARLAGLADLESIASCWIALPQGRC